MKIHQLQLFLLTGILLVGTLQATAQFSAGLKGGVNYATLTVDDPAATYSYAPGYQIGGFLLFSIPKVDFELDVVFSRQGASIESGGQKMTATSNNVNFPVLVKYKIIPAFSIQVGPQIGFLTCLESDYHPVTYEPFQTQDYTKAYNKSDFGVVVGGGWESGKILIDFRYYMGLTDMSNFPGVLPTKNKVMQLTVGYKLFKF